MRVGADRLDGGVDRAGVGLEVDQFEAAALPVELVAKRRVQPRLQPVRMIVLG